MAGTPEVAEQAVGAQLTAAQERTLAHTMLLTRIMDDCITVPFIGRRIGLDALIGLVPVAGAEGPSAAVTHIFSRYECCCCLCTSLA